MMDLCEAVNAGLVHEVWIYGDADVPDVSAAEVLELKPRYDANRVRIPGQPLDGCAGNGCFDAEDVSALPAHCTRTVRIGWVNNICVQEALDWYGGIVKYTTSSGQATIQPYVPACQNVHFAPNSRNHYDDASPQVQASTCENFRMRNGTNGQDKREVFSTSKFSAYNSLAPDCGGGWVMYWMQSMPGYNNQALDASGQPMLP
jgi:hypothetical protein